MNFTHILAAADASNIQSLTFAIAGLSFVAIIMGIAMFRFKIDGVMQIAGWLGTFMGLVAGAAITYFFNARANESDLAAAKANAQAEISKINLQNDKSIVELKARGNSLFADEIKKYDEQFASLQKQYGEALATTTASYNEKLAALDEKTKQLLADSKIPENERAELLRAATPQIPNISDKIFGGENSYIHHNLGLPW